MNRQLKRNQAAIRKLDRRNAMKNIDYDAASSPSSSFEDQSSPYRTRSLDIAALHSVDRTSFRIVGVDGEFDLICRSLGLSGPEDFGIPAAAWEARDHHKSVNSGPGKAKPGVNDPQKLENECPQLNTGFSRNAFDARTDYIEKVGNCDDKSCQLSNQQNLEKVRIIDSSTDNLSDAFGARVRVKDGNWQEHESSPTNHRFSPAKIEVRVGRNDEVGYCNEEACQFRTGGNRISVRSFRNCGIGINGAGPPALAPPPAVSLSDMDNTSSTWDLIRSFGPLSDDDSDSCLVSPLQEKKVTVEADDEIDRQVVGIGEVEWLGDIRVISESCSDMSDDKDDDFVSTSVEPLHFASPFGKFKSSTKSWQKGDFLGSGSFGTVYEGFTDDGYFFAVKEVSLLDQGDQGKQSIFQLEQEIFFLSQFEHENIVQYLGTDKDNCKLYIFLELVTKGSLANLYQKYNLQDSQVSAYTRQILNGLNYLHLRKVVHRDIKCANILVDASGSVKLADFGLAKAANLNDVKSCKGTAFWMAPEVVNRKNNGYGLAADIWSLGCTVLEMLTHRIPYSHLEGMQALYRIGKGEPPPVPDSLSCEARDFICKCLQVNPDDRPTVAQLLDHPFVKRPLRNSSAPASLFHPGKRSERL